MFTKRKTGSRKSGRSNLLGRKTVRGRRSGSRSRKTRWLDLSWQIVGMITIIVILMTFVFGDRVQADGWGQDSFLNKRFSEVADDLELGSFEFSCVVK